MPHFLITDHVCFLCVQHSSYVQSLYNSIAGAKKAIGGHDRDRNISDFGQQFFGLYRAFHSHTVVKIGSNWPKKAKTWEKLPIGNYID